MTRRDEAACMRRDELNEMDWVIPASRHKSKRDFLLPLSAAAREVLDRVPVIKPRGGRGFMFTTSGRAPISGFSKFKKNFDRLCGVTGWTHHDIRRTGRSLLSRAGIPTEHAEIALGHVIPGVRGVYDRHDYVEEKRRAFEALAAQIERILNPQQNVVQLRSG